MIMDMQEFFREYARVYLMVIREDFFRMMVLIDTHAPNYLRVNFNCRMTDEFQEAFDIREGDGMYVKPEERLTVWGK